jgi:hypothetical protein
MVLSEKINNSDAYLYFIFIGSFAIGTFDFLRLTIWLPAGWNYQYPEWALLYDPWALGIFIFISMFVVIKTDYLLSTNEYEFILIIVVTTILLSITSYFIVPIGSFRDTLAPLETVENFEYYPATVVVKDGISTFFSDYHSLPTTIHSGDRRETAKILSSGLRSSAYIPGNEWLASEMNEVVTQRHGPIPALLIATFLFIFGVSPEISIIGTHIFAIFLPLVGYVLFKQYFSVWSSRAGTLLLLFSPAYLRWQHTEAVGNDIITTILVGIFIITLLHSAKSNNHIHWFIAGVAFSLPALSKFTVATYGIPVVLIILVSQRNVKRSLISLGIFTIGFLILPTALFYLGFNMIIMYLFSVGKILVSSPDGGGFLQYFVSYYNLRWIGPPVLLLFFLSIIKALTEFKNIKKFGGTSSRLVLFIPAMIPFLFIGGVTLSRHFLIHIYIIGLSAVYWIDTGTSDTYKIQIYLISTLVVSLFAFS